MWGKLKENLFLKILFFILFIEIGLIIYANFALMRTNIDCDSAKLFVHAIEMWRNGTPIIPDWAGVSTLELDCSTLLAVPLYGLTQNIYVSFAIANVLFLLLLLSTVFYLFDSKEHRVLAVVSSILICIPYRIGMLDYFNMLFFNGSQYIIKVIIPILVLALLVHKNSEKNDKIKFIVFGIIYGVLLFVSCLSSGIYIILCGVLPVLVGCFLWRVFNGKRITGRYVVVAIESVLTAGAGFFLHSKYQIGSKGNEMKLYSIYDGLVEQFESCIVAIFELFGGVAYEEVKVMSYDGINILVRGLLVVVMLVCTIVVIVKTVKKEADEISLGLAAIFLWNIFILSICNTHYGAATFEYRYHLIGAVSLMLLSSKVIVAWIKKQPKKLAIGISICGLGIIGMLLFSSWKSVFTSDIDNSMYNEICDYTEEIGANYVYFLYESGAPEICRLIDHENALYFQLMDGGVIWVYGYYSQYDKVPMIEENFIVICDNGIYDFGESMEMQGYIFTRSKIIGTKSIYEVTGFVEG